MMVSNDRFPCRICPGFWCLIPHNDSVAPCLATRKRRTVVTEHHVRFSDPRKQPRRVHSSAEDGQTCQVSYPAGGSSSCRSRSCVASLTERCSSRSWLPGSSSSCWCSRGRRTRPRTPRRPQARPTPRRSRQSQRLVQWSARPSTPRHTPSPGTLAQRPRGASPGSGAQLRRRGRVRHGHQAPAGARDTALVPGHRQRRGPENVVPRAAGTCHVAGSGSSTQSSAGSGTRRLRRPRGNQLVNGHRPVPKAFSRTDHTQTASQLSPGFGRRSRGRSARPIVRRGAERSATSTAPVLPNLSGPPAAKTTPPTASPVTLGPATTTAAPVLSTARGAVAPAATAAAPAKTTVGGALAPATDTRAPRCRPPAGCWLP